MRNGQNIYRSEHERYAFTPEKIQDNSNQDVMLILPLILLLMQENADKTLLFALLYILM